MKNPFSSKPSASQLGAREPMSNQKLDGLIRQITSQVEGQLGHWKFAIEGRKIVVITDQRHNRMRIMSPVISQDKLDASEMVRLLEANFGSALDAKYALHEQNLWSVFTHPLGELSDEQFLDCVAQTANLANNFGHSYASSNLFFGGG